MMREVILDEIQRRLDQLVWRIFHRPKKNATVQGVTATGYLRGIHGMFDSLTTTNLHGDPDDPYDPDDDPPFTLTDFIAQHTGPDGKEL